MKQRNIRQNTCSPNMTNQPHTNSTAQHMPKHRPTCMSTNDHT